MKEEQIIGDKSKKLLLLTGLLGHFLVALLAFMEII
jgi:hypothetical protein